MEGLPSRTVVAGLARLAFAVVVSACGGAAAPAVRLPDAADFQPDEPAIVHEGYRFRLARPGDEQWVLLDENAARVLNPEVSAAAMLRGTGVNVQVLVERADVELDDVAELHALALSLKPASRSKQPTRHQGLPALDLRGVRDQQGAEILVRSRVLRHQGHLYELRVMAPRNLPGGLMLDEVYRKAVDAFAILSGEVRVAKPSTPPQADARGTNWRVKGGVYESAASGVRVRPPPGFRLILGSALDEVDPDADVALRSVDPPIFLALTSERVAQGQAEALQGYLRTQSVPVPDGEHHTLQLHGQPIEMARVRVEGVPDSVVTLYGNRFHQGRMHQLVFGLSTRAGRDRLAAAVNAIEFLEPAEEEALASELASGPDPEATLHGDHALWGGHFRDFGRGITWTKPDGQWSAQIGSVAAAQYENTILVATDDRHGLFAQLMPMGEVEVDARELLRTYVTEMVSEGRAQQIPIHPMDLEAESSATCVVDTLVDGIQFRFVPVAAVAGGRGVLFVVSGFRENMSGAGSRVQAALRGLALSTAALQTHTEQDGAFHNWLFGYRFTPPAGAVRKQQPVPGRPGVEAWIWIQERRVIALTAFARPGVAGRIGEMMRVIIQQQLQRLGVEATGVDVQLQDHTVAGRPGHRVSVEVQSMRLDFFGTGRGDQAYVIGVVQEQSEQSAGLATQVLEGFSLID